MKINRRISKKKKKEKKKEDNTTEIRKNEESKTWSSRGPPLHVVFYTDGAGAALIPFGILETHREAKPSAPTEPVQR